MKRIIVFLLLAALLLGGCGTRTPETEAREAQSTSTAAPGTETRDWSEPNAVDDGYSFPHDPEAYYEETRRFRPLRSDREDPSPGIRRPLGGRRRGIVDGVSWPEQRRKPERHLLRLDRLYRYAENRTRLAHGGLQRH